MPMKPPLHFFVLATACCSSSVSAQGEKVAPPALVSSTARILGNLPDGTPPPPAPPKPGFSVPAADILDRTVHEQGGRKITIQKISPIALPPPLVAEPPSDPASPAHLARIAALRARFPRNEIISLGATVYRSQDSPPRTLVRVWPAHAEKAVTFWSSADFALLSGCSSFVGSDGATRSLMMMWSTVDIDRMRNLMARKGRQYIPPAIPDLPLGKATFAIASGNPTTENLAAIQSLHDVYHNEHARLLTAHQGREQSRLAQAAELKANPPKPKDIVVNYWKIGGTSLLEGGGK